MMPSQRAISAPHPNDSKGAMSEITSTSRRYGHLIDGVEVTPANGYITRCNPANGEIVAEFANGTAEEAEQAILAARAEFDHGTWPQLSGVERARILQRWSALVLEHRDHLARIETEEGGKTTALAEGDIGGVADLIAYTAALALGQSGDAHTNFGPDFQAMVVHEPIGVVGAIVPWNFPSIIYAQKVPFALAAGCCVVVKPSEMTSGTAVELTRLAHEAGVPVGALSVVCGYGSPVGETLVLSEQVDMISFTGSPRTGLQVLKGQEVNFKRVALELGGKSAAIVFADADLDAAIEGVLFSIFMHQGQVCCAGSRLLIQDSIAEEFLERLAERVNRLRVGDPAARGTDIGPLISPEHRHLVAGHVDAAVAEGATIATVNVSATPTPSDSAFYPPVVLTGVTPKMEIFRTEVFGPVLTVTRFSSVHEAIDLANDSNFGLAGSVWTCSMNTALKVARGVRTGWIEVNTSIEGQPQLPFGGYRTSGIGREKGLQGLLEFTETKSIGIRTTPRAPFFA